MRLLQESPWRDLPVKSLLVMLDHRDPERVMASIQSWLEHGVSDNALLLVYGGREEVFGQIPWPNKLLLADPRLRTRDHQRERQSYRSILRAVTDWMQGRAFTHVLFMEYDQLPLASDVPGAYLERMRQTDADVLAYAVQRIDGSLHPHWLGLVQQTLHPEPVWSMMGTGHFWRREAWEAVTARDDYADWYLELDLATSAVRLGFRLVGLPDQDPFVRPNPRDLPCGPEAAAAQGAWTLHPVKGSLPRPGRATPNR